MTRLPQKQQILFLSAVGVPRTSTMPGLYPWLLLTALPGLTPAGLPPVSPDSYTQPCPLAWPGLRAPLAAFSMYTEGAKLVCWSPGLL